MFYIRLWLSGIPWRAQVALSETPELIMHGEPKEKSWKCSRQSFLIIQHLDNLNTTEAGVTGNKSTVMYYL